MAPCLGQRVALQGKVLVYGRHAGIADQHRFRRDIAGIGRSRSRDLRRGRPKSPLRAGSSVTGLCPFDRHEPSRNSTALRPFARLKSRMSFESGLSHFRACFFGLDISSQKRPFLRAIPVVRNSSLLHQRSRLMFAGRGPLLRLTRRAAYGRVPPGIDPKPISDALRRSNPRGKRRFSLRLGR